MFMSRLNKVLHIDSCDYGPMTAANTPTAPLSDAYINSTGIGFQTPLSAVVTRDHIVLC